MKDAKKSLWEDVEAQASCLEKRVENLKMQIPSDAKSAEELLREDSENFIEYYSAKCRHYAI